MRAAETTGTLEAAEWSVLEQAHQERADAFTAGRRARVGAGQTHPVDDFLFVYYPFRPGLLRRWHPGAGVRLADAAGHNRADWKWYLRHGNDVQVDAEGFAEAHQRSIRYIVTLLCATRSRTANFGCFGMHEWAMVYRQGSSLPGSSMPGESMQGAAMQGEHRHQVPLRLGQAATDEVVEASHLVCSHFDAFRFFTPAASGLNLLQPTRDTQPQLEQPGCLHAGMDVYKWVIKLAPLLPGHLLLDSFELARDIRELDMQASPYDLRDWGYSPVEVETLEGKTEYASRQRVFTERGNALRDQVLTLLG
jgi:hypothetical protein